MPETPDFDRIISVLNQKYGTTLSREIIEIAVAAGFTSWAALQREASVDPPVTLCGYPVRLDATLCAPDELWIEGPRGDAVRVWPEPVKDPA